MKGVGPMLRNVFADRVGRRRRWLPGTAMFVVLAFLVAACGGKAGHQTTDATQAESSSTTAETSTAVTSGSDVAVSSTTSTTLGSVLGSATVTTSKTTASKTTTKTNPASKVGVASTVRGGIANVTTPSTTAPRVDIQPGGAMTLYQPAEIATIDP